MNPQHFLFSGIDLHLATVLNLPSLGVLRSPLFWAVTAQPFWLVRMTDVFLILSVSVPSGSFSASFPGLRAHPSDSLTEPPFSLMVCNMKGGRSAFILWLTVSNHGLKPLPDFSVAGGSFVPPSYPPSSGRGLITTSHMSCQPHEVDDVFPRSAP